MNIKIAINEVCINSKLMKNIFLICVVKLVFNELNNLISPLDVAVVRCLYTETNWRRTKIRKRRRTCIDVTARLIRPTEVDDVIFYFGFNFTTKSTNLFLFFLFRFLKSFTFSLN